MKPNSGRMFSDGVPSLRLKKCCDLSTDTTPVGFGGRHFSEVTPSTGVSHDFLTKKHPDDACVEGA